MKIFVINLARRPDRLRYMQSQLAEFERFDAVDGTAVPRPPVRGFLFWCAKGYRIRPGEIGCVLSHRAVCRLMLERNLKVACVLEDDVRLGPDFAARLDALSTELETDLPVVLTFAETTAGYLLNRAAARLLVSVNDPIRAPVDSWARWERRGLVRCQRDGFLETAPYGDPSVSGVTHSDIIGDARHFYVNMNWPRKVLYRVLRVFGRFFDLLADSFDRRSRPGEWRP